MPAQRRPGRTALFGYTLLTALCFGGIAAAEPFSITSSSFKDGAVLDKKYVGNIKTNPNCVGENVSPALSWSNPPADTKSFAILVIDPEGRAPAGVAHWSATGSQRPQRDSPRARSVARPANTWAAKAPWACQTTWAPAHRLVSGSTTIHSF
jgi:phosphatidylethanolamine-binding protein (PEBP) family uncharacterized protein